MNGFAVKRREEEEGKRRSRDEKWWPWKKKKIEDKCVSTEYSYTVTHSLHNIMSSACVGPSCRVFDR